MRAHQAHYPVATQCRLLDVSTSGYYAWQRRGMSARAEADRELLAMIQAIHASSHGTYGAPRIHAELGARGVCVGRKRVARLMRSMSLAGVSRRKRPHTTVRSRGAAIVPDLAQRQFSAEAPDRLWVADITYVPTGAGFLYLAVVVDGYSRRVVGWAMGSHLRTELVLQALNMALSLRRPQGVIHHSDQGIQYPAYAFGKRCSEWGVRPSMGSVGDCYDNALCESFFASLECELLDRRSFQTHAEARMAVSQYIEGWYNTHRLHSSIGYYAPIAFERRYTSSIQHAEPLTVHQIGSTPVNVDDRGPMTPLQDAYVDWILQRFLAVPNPVMIGYTKTLAPDPKKGWSTVSERHFEKRLRAMHDKLSDGGAFSIEGKQYLDLHAHGFVAFPSNSPEGALHVRQDVESHMDLSLPKGFSKVEIVRDPFLWIRY